MKLTQIYIVVGKQVRPALGDIRGGLVMVPSTSGPLYFHKPQWFESREDAEKYLASKKK